VCRQYSLSTPSQYGPRPASHHNHCPPGSRTASPRTSFRRNSRPRSSCRPTVEVATSPPQSTVSSRRSPALARVAGTLPSPVRCRPRPARRRRCPRRRRHHELGHPQWRAASTHSRSGSTQRHRSRFSGPPSCSASIDEHLICRPLKMVWVSRRGHPTLLLANALATRHGKNRLGSMCAQPQRG
jgi:hypothetical protein